MKAVAAILSLFAFAPAFAQLTGFNVGDFDFVVLNDATVKYSEVKGTSAIGHKLNATGYGWANGISGSVPAATPTLVVGNNATLSGGQLDKGTLYYGNTYTNLGGFNPINGVSHSLPFNFADVDDLYRDISDYAGSLAANGTTFTANSWEVVFTGSSTGLNVFNVDAAFLNNRQYVFNVPAGAPVLVNVTGMNVALSNQGYFYNGTNINGGSSQGGKVLWNLYQANSVSHTSFGGTLLAPDATASVAWASGGWGQYIVKNITGAGGYAQFEVNTARYVAWSSILPPSPVIPEPAAVGGMMALLLGIVGFRRAGRRA